MCFLNKYPQRITTSLLNQNFFPCHMPFHFAAQSFRNSKSTRSANSIFTRRPGKHFPMFRQVWYQGLVGNTSTKYINGLIYNIFYILFKITKHINRIKRNFRMRSPDAPIDTWSKTRPNQRQAFVCFLFRTHTHTHTLYGWNQRS